MKHSLSYFIMMILILFSSAVFAASTASKDMTGDDFMKKGDDAWQAENFNSAISYYGKAAKQFTDKEGQAKAYFHKGLGFYQLGQWDAALASFEMANTLNLNKKLSQQLHHYMGLCYYAKRNKEQASEYLQKAISYAPGTSDAELSRMFLNRANNLKEKKWSLFSSFGYFFSDNVPFNPLTGPKNDPNVKTQTGNAINLLLEPTYAAFLGKHSVFTLASTFFSNYNLTSDHRAYDTYKYGVTSNVKIPALWKNTPIYFSLPLSYAATFSGVETRRPDNSADRQKGFFDQISNVYTFNPSAQFMCSSRWDTTLDFVYDHEDYKEGQGSLNSRDGFKYGAGLDEGLRVWGMNWNGGYNYFYFDSEGENYKSHNHEGHLSTYFPFWFRTNINLNGQLVRKVFINNSNSRKDFSKSLGVSIVKVFDNLVGMSFNTTVARNVANPSTTSYNLFTVSTNLFYNF